MRMSQAGEAARQPQQSGFTLIELVAVMALVALVLGIVLPAVQIGNSASNLKAVATQVVWRLRDARSEAINRHRQIVVKFDMARRIVNANHRREPLRFASDISLTLTVAGSETLARRVSGIRFFPNGSSTGGTLLLRRNRQAYEIRVNWLTGRAHIQQLF